MFDIFFSLLLLASCSSSRNCYIWNTWNMHRCAIILVQSLHGSVNCYWKFFRIYSKKNQNVVHNHNLIHDKSTNSISSKSYMPVINYRWQHKAWIWYFQVLILKINTNFFLLPMYVKDDKNALWSNKEKNSTKKIVLSICICFNNIWEFLNCCFFLYFQYLEYFIWIYLNIIASLWRIIDRSMESIWLGNLLWRHLQKFLFRLMHC